MSNSEVIFEFPRKIFYAASYGFMPTFPIKAYYLSGKSMHPFSGKGTCFFRKVFFNASFLSIATSCL